MNSSAGDDDEPTELQLATLRAMLEKQAIVRDAVVRAMRADYDLRRPKYIAFALANPDFMGDPEVSMPERPDAAIVPALRGCVHYQK